MQGYLNTLVPAVVDFLMMTDLMIKYHNDIVETIIEILVLKRQKLINKEKKKRK